MTESSDGDQSSTNEGGPPGPLSEPVPVLPIGHLMAQLIDRAGEIITAQDRLQRLLSANRAIVGELSLPMVLRRIVEAARDLVGAHYAALGVIGDDNLLEQFIHVGMDSETVAVIGDLPRGRGVLGALIKDPNPIRLPRIGDDERSSGFPPGHPPMDTFLGVPIRSRNTVFGNLYLTGRTGGEFTADDEDLLLALAATAGIAIENARLYEESGRRERWLEASAEISGALLSPDGDGDPLQLIVDSMKRLADADATTLVVPLSDPALLRVAVATGDGEDELRGLAHVPRDPLVARAMETGRGVRIGALEERQGHAGHLSQVFDVGALMAVPMSGETGPQGAIVLGRRRGRRNFTNADQDMAHAFANHAALARELVEARADQQRLAVLEDRDRIARDLHDHVVQRLFATGLSVQSLIPKIADDAVRSQLTRIAADTADTIGQVRTSIFELRTSEPGDPGLRAAILAVVQQARPALPFQPTLRFTGPVDTLVHGAVIGDIEAVVREGMTNVAKHAQASALAVHMSADSGWLLVEISDNGIGNAEGAAGDGWTERRSGLENLSHRAKELGGTLAIEHRPTGGTLLQWTIPMPD